MKSLRKTIFPYAKHELHLEHSHNLKNPKAVVLILHGLNNPPSSMMDIVKLFNSLDVYTINSSFKGHHGETPLEDMKTITLEEWRKEVFSAYLAAREKADELGVPLYFSGYSTGPLILNHLLNDSPGVPLRIDKQFLFAPALALKVSTIMRETLAKISGRIVVPSFYHHEFRKHRGSTIAAYKAIFKLIRSLRKTKFTNSNMPTLIIIDSNDELISHLKLTKLIRKFNLTKWRMLKIDNKHEYQDKTDKIHHLIIAERLIGSIKWFTVKDQIKELIESQS